MISAIVKDFEVMRLGLKLTGVLHLLILGMSDDLATIAPLFS